MRRGLLFNWNILIAFNLALHWYHFNFLFGNDFLVVLYSFLDGIEVLLDDFSRHCLHNFSLLVCDDLSLDWHLLHICPVFVLNHFLFVGHVADSALPCVLLDIPLTTSSCLT